MFFFFSKIGPFYKVFVKVAIAGNEFTPVKASFKIVVAIQPV